jgi:glycosyltransferase involved in cell wall biosynthesis
MKMVVERFPQTRLVCVGDGSCRRNLEAQTGELGLNRNVKFVGFQANMPDWLALADLVVLPSLYEGLPLIAIEALAAGRAMVATNVDGTCEVVVNEKTGLIVPPRDSGALAYAILRMLDNPSFRRGCGQAGRMWVEEQFNQHVQIRSTEAFYLQAARETASPRLRDEGATPAARIV